MRREHQITSVTNVIANVANDVHLGAGDASDRLTVVRVAENLTVQNHQQMPSDRESKMDDTYHDRIHKCCLRRREQLCGIVDELSTLAVPRHHQLRLWALALCSSDQCSHVGRARGRSTG